MRIALIGAAGLEEVMNQGHEVTAIVRESPKIKTQNDKLTVIKADATNAEEAVAHLQNHDVAESAYNTRNRFARV